MYIMKKGKRKFETEEGIIFELTPEAMNSLSTKDGRIPLEKVENGRELERALKELNQLGYDIKPINGQYLILTEIERKPNTQQDEDISALLDEERIDPDIPIIDKHKTLTNPRRNRRDSSGIYLRREFFSSEEYT